MADGSQAQEPIEAQAPAVAPASPVAATENQFEKMHTELAPNYDVGEVHKLLDAADALYHKIFGDGSVVNEVERFEAKLGTVRDIVSQSSDMAPKNLVEAAKNAARAALGAAA